MLRRVAASGRYHRENKAVGDYKQRERKQDNRGVTMNMVFRCRFARLTRFLALGECELRQQHKPYHTHLVSSLPPPALSQPSSVEAPYGGRRNARAGRL